MNLISVIETQNQIQPMNVISNYEVEYNFMNESYRFISEINKDIINVRKELYKSYLTESNIEVINEGFISNLFKHLREILQKFINFIMKMCDKFLSIFKKKEKDEGKIFSSQSDSFDDAKVPKTVKEARVQIRSYLVSEPDNTKALKELVSKYEGMFKDLYQNDDNKTNIIDKSKWDKEYFVKINTDLAYNFSKKKIDLAIKVGGEIYKYDKGNMFQKNLDQIVNVANTNDEILKRQMAPTMKNLQSVLDELDKEFNKPRFFKFEGYNYTIKTIATNLFYSTESMYGDILNEILQNMNKSDYLKDDKSDLSYELTRLENLSVLLEPKITVGDPDLKTKLEAAFRDGKNKKQTITIKDHEYKSVLDGSYHNYKKLFDEVPDRVEKQKKTVKDDHNKFVSFLKKTEHSVADIKSKSPKEISSKLDKILAEYKIIIPKMVNAYSLAFSCELHAINQMKDQHIFMKDKIKELI